MNVSTILKFAKDQANYIYTENDDNELCSCDSYDYEVSSLYLEKRQKLLSRLEMKTKSVKNLN